MDVSKYKIEIKHHTFKRALQRKINPDLIENTIKTGKVTKQGKNYIKFIGKNIICIGQISQDKIKIITIEKRGGK